MKNYQNQGWLKTQYLDNKRTLKDIGIECGVSWGTIKYWCDKYQISLRDPHDIDHVRAMQRKCAEQRKKKICREWLRSRYEDKGMTAKEIAKEYGCNWATIIRRLDEYGILIRKPKIRKWKSILRWLEQDYFSDTKLLKQVMIKIFGYSCMVDGCTYKNFIELHHINGKNFVKNGCTGRKHTKNCISNSVLLCPNHHKEADYGMIKKRILKKTINHKIVEEKVRHSK